MKAETVVTTVAAGGTSLIAGTALGVPVLSLIFGLGGGLVAMTWAKKMPWWKVLLTLAASTLTGGALGPLAAAHIHTEGVPPQTELIAASFVVGAGFQVILQALIAATVNRINQAGGKS